MHFGWCGESQGFAREHRCIEIADTRFRKIGIVLKTRLAETVRIGQRNPQLRRMDMPRLLAFFGVRNAASGSHQIDLTGADDLLGTKAVAMQHFSANHPGESLQTDMRMRPHLHARRRGIGRPRVIEKAPCPHLAQRALRNRAMNRNAAHIGNAGGQVLGRRSGGVVHRDVVGKGFDRWRDAQYPLAESMDQKHSITSRRYFSQLHSRPRSASSLTCEMAMVVYAEKPCPMGHALRALAYADTNHRRIA